MKVLEKVGVFVEDELKDGPKRSRSCTDILCCLIFAAFWGLSTFIFIQSLRTGDVSKIAKPYDADGRLQFIRQLMW